MSSSPTELLIDVAMPQMGVSVAEGTVVEWRKHPGDWVQADEIIAAISTDKIDTDVESPATGRVEEILVPVGETVDVGTVIARIATGADHAAENGAAPTAAEPEAVPPAPEAVPPAPAAAAAARPERSSPRARRYSPVVQRIAAEHGIDLEAVHGTGRDGRVRKQDVLAAVEAGAGGDGVPEAPMHIESPYVEEPGPPRRAAAPAPAPAPAPGAADPAAGSLSRVRQAIGARMVQSLQTAATCTSIIEADVTGVERERRRAGLTALPYIARATVETLREHPALNATLDGDAYTVHDAVHLGIAVSLGEDGLIVPVIRDAQNLSVEGLAAQIKDLARRARTNALAPDEVRGGTFTITNPGGYGTLMATPVINQPQVAILDTEAVVKRPVVVTDAFGEDAIAIRAMTYLCMSWDHRALDGVAAAKFLATLRKKLETLPTTSAEV